MLKQILCLTITLPVLHVTGEPPDFRILAPEFVCPKNEDTTQVKPDNTVITIRMKANLKLNMHWTVRWTPLPAPTQRFTLMLWRATRALEKKLNGPQIEPYVYAIQNDELVSGVDYIFNVTASNSEDETTLKSFHINNVLGDQKLENIAEQAERLSILLVGAQETYADVHFVLEALVTSCYPTQDYYVEWAIHSETDEKVDTASTGSRLEIPAYSLSAGLTYCVSCQVVRHSNGDLIAQNSVPFTVLHRTFEIYLNVDRLIVPIDTPFAIESLVLKHDYFGDSLTYAWQCHYDGKYYSFFESTNNATLFFEIGLPKTGKYEVALTVSAQDYNATVRAVITAVQHHHILPVIQISPLPRTLNEGAYTSLVANASNVTPTCSLTWYFASEEYLQSQGEVLGDTCDDCQHGEPLTETLNINSLEENFLYELTDFSNETEWKQVTAALQAAAGRARFVVQCGCSVMVDCDRQKSVYADIVFKLNRISKANNLMITPESGSALETIFRISTLAAEDPNTPLFYTFFCRVDFNSSLILGSYTDHLAVETFLPFIEDGTEIWVEVCDVLGACSRSDSRIVNLFTRDGTTVNLLLGDARAHVRRCELMQLQRVTIAAVVTYKNADQLEALTEFCTRLLTALPETQEGHCLKAKPYQYQTFLMQLLQVGCNTTHLI